MVLGDQRRRADEDDSRRSVRGASSEDLERTVAPHRTDRPSEAFKCASGPLHAPLLVAAGRGTHALDLTAVFTSDAMGRLETSARTVLAACQEGDTLRTSLAFLRGLARREPLDTVTLRRRIAARLIESEKYLSG